MTKKKKEKETDNSLEKLILESPENKYELILLATRWAKEKYKKAKAANQPPPIVEDALLDILKGTIGRKEILSTANAETSPKKQ